MFPSQSSGSRRIRPTLVRTGRIPRPLSRYGDNVHSFARIHDLYNPITFDSTTTTHAQFQSFSFSDVPDFNQFCQLFDWYKLDKIEVHFQPSGNTSGIQANTAQSSFPMTIHTAIDHGITGTPASAADLYQYTSYKCSRGMDEHVRVLYPKINQTTDEGGVTQFLEPKGATWLSTAGTGLGVPHYGLLMFIDCSNLAGGAAGISIGMRVWARYFFSLKIQS